MHVLAIEAAPIRWPVRSCPCAPDGRCCSGKLPTCALRSPGRAAVAPPAPAAEAIARLQQTWAALHRRLLLVPLATAALLPGLLAGRPSAGPPGAGTRVGARCGRHPRRLCTRRQQRLPGSTYAAAAAAAAVVVHAQRHSIAMCLTKQSCNAGAHGQYHPLAPGSRERIKKASLALSRKGCAWGWHKRRRW
jgi:hypothetical protein